MLERLQAGSVLDMETDCPDWEFCDLCQYLEAKARILLQSRPC